MAASLVSGRHRRPRTAAGAARLEILEVSCTMTFRLQRTLHLTSFEEEAHRLQRVLRMLDRPSGWVPSSRCKSTSWARSAAWR